MHARTFIMIVGMRSSITAKASRDESERVFDFADEVLESFNVPYKETMRIHVALDEIVSNIVNYAYEDEGTFSLSLDVEENVVTMEVRDHGFPYNPLLADEPDITAPLEERKIGGYGIFIVRQIMDDVQYAREGDENVLKMIKKF